MCWWLPPPCGCSTGFMATPRTCKAHTSSSSLRPRQLHHSALLLKHVGQAAFAPHTLAIVSVHRQRQHDEDDALAAERALRGERAYLGPAVPLGLVLVVGVAGLEHGLLSPAASGHLSDHGAACAGDHLH